MGATRLVSAEYPHDVRDVGFFVLRTPTLPIDDFLTWTSGLETTALREKGENCELREATWRNDVATLRDRLREQIDRPEVTHALSVAAPALQTGIAHWRTNPDSKKGLQAERALVRYFTRMCTRCTPFGLFSGCSFGQISSDNSARPELVLMPRQFYRTKTRLDYEYLFALTDSLGRERRILRELRYHPNTSLHKCGRYWHYVECTKEGEGPSRVHQLVKVESDALIDAVLERAGAPDGATLSEMLTTLQNHGVEVHDSDVEDYVIGLVVNKILVSTLTPVVTGDSPLDEIVDQLKTISAGQGIADQLRRVQEELAVLDKKPIGSEVADYERITAVLPPVESAIQPGRLYQVDMAKPAESILLTANVLNEVVGAVEVLCRLSVNREDEALTNFRKTFTERYERASIPLLEVLDEESGIGFGPPTVCESTAIRGLQLEDRPTTTSESLSPSHKFLLEKVASSKSAGELRLDLADIPQFEGENSQLPPSFCLNVELIATSCQALDNGDFQVLVNGTYGPDGALSLSRFCHVEPQLTSSIREYLRSVQLNESDAILAEVVHLPEGRSGNVIHRPVLRDHEIVYLGRSGAAPDRQIPASDLLVTIGENDEICLVSRRLGRRIIPRLTTAHGFFSASFSPVYRFLGALQYQNGVRSPRFSWGPLYSLPFLPRVVIGRVVVAVGQWRLIESEIKEVSNEVGWRRFEKIQDLRDRRSLPRFVELKDDDQTFLVDLENALSVDAFVQVLGRQREATIREVFPGFRNTCVTSREGHFCHELQIPVIRHDTVGTNRGNERDDTKAIRLIERRPLRSFAPGSEWLFCKIYGGLSALDRILTMQLRPLVERSVGDSIVNRYFFVRYADPSSHIRLRFNGEPERLMHELLPRISTVFEPLVESGVVWKLQFDTYVREVERYGGLEGIIASEDIFRADSEAVLEILSALEPSDDLNVRWRVALLGIDTLLADCELVEDETLAVLKQLRDGSQSRFRVDQTLRKTLGDRFRLERSALAGIQTNLVNERIWQVARDSFQYRSKLIRVAIARLKNLHLSGKLSVPISDLAKHYIHMHVNRMMSKSPNQHELILYDFLFRLHDGNGARRRIREMLSKAQSA